MAEMILCIDAGQSGVRAQLREGPRILAETSTPGVIAGKQVLPQLMPVIEKTMVAFTGQVQTVCAGLSGFGEGENAQVWLDSIARFGFTQAFAAHDSITSYLGALGQQLGVMAAVGTGTVILSVGKTATARVDGWGHLLGDAGSGYWIGRAGLDLVLRAFDGRGEETRLTEYVKASYPRLDQMYLQLQADPERVAKIASWAKLVAQLGEIDSGCRKILAQAATELACSVCVGLEKTGQGALSNPMIGQVGQIFNSTVLREIFEQKVLARHPQAVFVKATGKGLLGAGRLAELCPESALFKDVLVANR